MKITEHVHALKIPFRIPVSSELQIDRYVYVYLVMGPQVWLIDSAVASGSEAIGKYLAQHGGALDQISDLFLTHAHPDHIGGAKSIEQASRCRVWAHPAEKTWIEDVELQFSQRPVPGFHTLVSGSTQVTRELKEGLVLEMDDVISLKVLETPGHSKGSVSLLLGPDNVLFTGDAIPMPGDLPIYDDVLSMVESLKKLKTVADTTFLLPAWGEPVQGSRIGGLIDMSLAYVRNIHEAVLSVDEEVAGLEPLAFCQKVQEKTGLTKIPPNPILAKTFMSHLAVKNSTFVI